MKDLPEIISLAALIVVVLLYALADKRTIKRGEPVDHQMNFIRLALTGATIYVFAGLLPYMVPVIDLTYRQLIILPLLMVLIAWTEKDTLMALILRQKPWFLGTTAWLDIWQRKICKNDGSEQCLKLVWFTKLALIGVLLILMVV